MKKIKGQISLYVLFFIVAFLLITIAAVLIPMGIEFTTQSYAASELILTQANSSLSNIQDASIKAEMMGAIGTAKDTASDHVSILSDMFQYSWVFVLILVVVILFLYGRRLVETGQQGFV